MALQPATGRPAPATRGFRFQLLTVVVGLVAIAMVAAVLNFTGILAVPGGPLLPPGLSASGGDGFSGVGLLPSDDRPPGHPWVVRVVIENHGSSDVSQIDASFVDVLTGTEVIGIYVDSSTDERCTATFDAACVAEAVAGGDIGVQTLGPGEVTNLMVVMNAVTAYTGFRDISIRYRSGLLTYTTRLSQGAWACVGVQREACPDNPWPAN